MNTKLTQGCTSNVVENMHMECEILILIFAKTSVYVRMYKHINVRAFTHTHIQTHKIIVFKYSTEN